MSYSNVISRFDVSGEAEVTMTAKLVETDEDKILQLNIVGIMSNSEARGIVILFVADRLACIVLDKILNAQHNVLR